MAQGDLYEVTVNQTFKGQDISNVYHYFQELAFLPVGVTHANVLAENFTTQMMPAILQCQVAEVVTTAIVARNLFNDADAFEKTVSMAGTQDLASVHSLPTFNAVSFALNGDNPSVKNGAKRYAGVTESWVDDGVITEAGVIGHLTTLAGKLADPVTVGLVIQDPCFVPVIIKRVRTGSPGNYSYRLPTSSAGAVFSRVILAAFNALITSQISRKIGKGN